MQNKRIAITGGIGSGKSQVVSVLNELGFKTLSSDKIVASLYKTHKVKALIKEHFPTAVRGNTRLKIVKKELSRLAFSSLATHKLLTDLVTPMVMQEIDRLTKNKSGVWFVEVPLLFECNYQNNFDDVWVITRPLEKRIESVKIRSNLSEEQVLERIKKQVDYDKLDLSPFTIIENFGDLENLKQIVINKIKIL